MSSSVDETVMEKIEKDEFLQNFLHPILNNITVTQSNNLLSVTEQITKLSEGIAALDNEIQKQILENHEDLLFHATWIEKLEDVLEAMSVHTQSLLSGSEKIILKILEPSKKMEELIKVANNILRVLNVLRSIQRVQEMSQKLPPHLSSSTDILKTSETILELDKFLNEVDLSNIQILENDQRKLKTVRDEISEKTKVQLLAGIQKLKIPQITSAVQIFFNLNNLVSVIKDFTASCSHSTQKIIDDNLGALLESAKGKGMPGSDVSKRGPGKAAMPSVGNASSFRPRLWTALDEIFESIYTYSLQIEFLEATLRQNTEDFMLEGVSYIEKFCKDERDITDHFWHTANLYLAEQLVKCSKRCKFVREALEGEYPRFLRLYMDLFKKLEISRKPLTFRYPFPLVKDVIAPFEQSYLSNLDSVVSYPVHNMFSTEATPKAVPSTEDIDSLIRIIRSELSVALFDPNLSSTIARNITKSIGTFCANCEEHIVVQGPDAVQVIGPRKAAQDRNIEIANRLEYLKEKLKNVTSNLGKDSDAAEILNLSLVTYADNLIIKIISAMLDSVVQAIKKIILTMHVEDFSREGEKESSMSLYMRELTTFVARSYSAYLKPFESQDVLKKCCADSGKYCMEFFLRHISLVRPLGAGGRMRLTADCNEFETAMLPLLGEEPKSYRMLRLFKLMLTQTPQEILNNAALGETVPYSLVLFYLFSFAPDDMKSPHESGVDPKIKSIDTLSEFLDSHQLEHDRIDLINRTLAKYCESVRQVPGKNFDPVYGVMAILIQRFRTSLLQES